MEPPEPDLAPAELVERARALRPLLLERQAETEERRYYAEDVHREFERAGFYRIYVPRRYGGYEFGLPTFVRVGIELARGCPSSAWCLLLAAAHALQIGSWFPEEAQAALFGDGDFRCASVAAPLSEPARRREGGWELNGKVSYASGIPYSTHYMGQAATPEGAPLLFVAPRSEWRMLDDWGDLLGLKGSGSHSVVFEGGFVPDLFALEGTFMIDVDAGATPGFRVHENPLYLGRTMGPFAATLAAVMVGAAWGAIDEYERMMETRTTPLPPMIPRRDDLDFQRYLGAAIAKTRTAEAALLSCAEQHMELCRRYAEDGIAATFGEDMEIGCIGREVMVQAWETVQSDLWRTVGSSAARAGERIERIYRDLTIGNGHRNTSLRDWAFREIARERLGVPSQLARG